MEASSPLSLSFSQLSLSLVHSFPDGDSNGLTRGPSGGGHT